MSTKIYNGLIAVDRDPFVLHDKMRKVLEPIFLDKFDQNLQRLADFEGQTWEDAFTDVNWRSPRYQNIGKMMVRNVKEYGTGELLYRLIKTLQDDPFHTFSNLDFGYKAVLLPNGMGEQYRPLVLVFSERAGDEYREALIAAGVVREYGYWNNSDKPDDISIGEWRCRKEAWDKLDVPARDGLNITMPSEFEAVWRRRV